MKNLFADADRQEILARFDALGPDSERQWGTMTLGKMICHCGDQLRLGLGEVKVKPIKTPVGLPGISWLVIHVVPWPKGVKTAPQLLATDPEALDADRARLRELIAVFASRDRRGEWGVHPLFGKISGHDWGRLAWRHLDHHLRQFGH